MFILLIQVFEDKHGVLLSFPKTVKMTLMKILSLHYKKSSTLLIGCGTDFTMTFLRAHLQQRHKYLSLEFSFIDLIPWKGQF